MHRRALAAEGRRFVTAPAVALLVGVPLAVVLTVGFTVHDVRLDGRSVATTFGTTDATVTRSAIRRVVTGHAILASGFNTVILGLVIAAPGP